MALQIPQSDRIYNQEPLPEGFNPDDPRQVNADWIMRMFDKIVNGEYAMKSFKTYSNFTDLPNTAEQGETAYVEEDTYKNNIFIYNGSSWIMAGGGGNVIVDSSLSTTSTNPVQNKVVTQAIQTILPSQDGNEGKFLSTDGEESFWADINEGILNLFDIKIMSKRIASKNWCCISDSTQKKLSADEVPTAYDFLSYKLDNVDKVSDPLSTISEINNTSNSPLLQTYLVGEENYVILNQDSNTCYLYKTDISNISDTSAWTLVNNYTINPSFFNFLTGKKVSCYTSYNDGGLIIINNEDLSTIKAINENIVPKFYFDGYFYGTYGSLYRWKDSIDSDDIELEFVVAVFGFQAQSSNQIEKIFAKIGNYYYFNVRSSSGTTVVAARATDLTDTSTYECMGYWEYVFVDYYNHQFILMGNNNYYITDEQTSPNGSGYGSDYFTFDNMVLFDNLNNLDLGDYTALSVNKTYDIVYRNDNGQYTLKFVGSGTVLFLHTDNFISYTKIIDGSYGYGDITTLLYDNINGLIVSDYELNNTPRIDGRLRTAGFTKTVYTDTINGIDIKYYKNGDWKICTPDIAVGNDTNLQSVYEFLGYLNYWWIDTANEQITLQRNSNLWTMMYVGDNYEDILLPNGNYRKNKLVNELIEDDNASITIDVKGNQFYKFTNNAITDITIDSCEESIEETTIKFTTGNSAPTLTDNASLVWYNGIPTLLANTSYTIVIVDKTAYYQEN